MDNFNPIQEYYPQYNSYTIPQYNYPQYQNTVVQTDDYFHINEMEAQMLHFVRSNKITLQQLKYYVKKRNSMRERYHIETEPISEDEVEINTVYCRDGRTQQHMIHRFSSFLIKKLIENKSDITFLELKQTIRAMGKSFFGYVPSKRKTVGTNTDLMGPVQLIPTNYDSHCNNQNQEQDKYINRHMLPFYINTNQKVQERKNRNIPFPHFQRTLRDQPHMDTSIYNRIPQHQVPATNMHTSSSTQWYNSFRPHLDHTAPLYTSNFAYQDPLLPMPMEETNQSIGFGWSLQRKVCSCRQSEANLNQCSSSSHGSKDP